MHVTDAPLRQVDLGSAADQLHCQDSYRMSSFVEFLNAVDSACDNEFLTERVCLNTGHVPKIEHVVNTEGLLLTQCVVAAWR